ncbi:MAG TPA: hypothetical protein VKX40_06410, partial [Aequorivita sp.]|nr:hypothetical protein [Aequorivita sp.]
MAEYDYDEVEQGEGGSINFDFKGYLFKVLNLWKFVLACIGVALIIAYLINVRKQNVYKLDSLISVENDQNPFFTANTSISFNWGGVSGKMGKTITTLQTRTHNEKVVDSLKSYMNYFVEGKYRKIDVYTDAPFIFELDKSKPQVLGQFIGIRFLSNTHFEVFTEFKSDKGSGQRYDTRERVPVALPTENFTQEFQIGQNIDLPFFHGVVYLRNDRPVKPGVEFL